MKTMAVSALAFSAICTIAAAMIVSRPSDANAGPAPCDAATIHALENSTQPVTIACSVTLKPGEQMRSPVIISGSAASGTLIDCKSGGIRPDAADEVALTIASVRRGRDEWDAPRHIVVRNCTIDGAIRIVGMGINGEAETVRLSSLSAGHTARAQAAAPSDISLSNLRIATRNAIPLYVGPGTTGLTVTGSTFSGNSGSVAIYLDAESGGNTIAGNDFKLTTSGRELIAVDGSAHNGISGNTFENATHGGIFLYRNCGEGGTIRHQPPEYNTISDNLFVYGDRSFMSWWATKPAVWLGSRQGGRSYCFHDAGHPFGSSLNSRDEARHNIVANNREKGGSPSLFVDDDADNKLVGNR